MSEIYGTGNQEVSNMDSTDAAFRKRTFFTLIELMLVTSVILILGALSVSSVANSRRQARQAFCTNNLRQIALAFQMYQQDYRKLPVTERFLDDFRPVYSYAKSLNVFTCPGNPSTVAKISTQSALSGGTDYCFWNGQLASSESSSSSPHPCKNCTSTCGCPATCNCNCNKNNCTCKIKNGVCKGNNGANGNGNSGNGNSGSTGSSTFFAYGADVSDSKFQRTLADKLTRPVLYDKCGPAHGNYINLCDLRDTSVSSRRDMCDLWVLDSSKVLIVDSIDPFPK